MATRSISELLQIIGAQKVVGYLSPHDALIVRAVQENRISNLEARTLQGFARASPKSQKRRLEAANQSTPEAHAKLRAKLDRLQAQFYEMHPERRSDDES